MRVEAIKRLRTLVPFDVSFFATVDPATLLFTGAITDAILERVTPQFLANEFLHEDVNKFSWLARSEDAVGGLMHATRQQMEQSPRYREILAPLALGDELRAALVVQDVCWGVLCLHRDRSSLPFTATDAAALRRLAPHLAEGLRSALLLGPVSGSPIAEAPGVLLLADDLSIAAMTPSAERWLAEVAAGDRRTPSGLPAAVYAAAARLQACERETAPAIPPRARLRTASGQWLVLHAARLAGRMVAGEHADGQIAVILEVARPVEMTPLIAQAYGLSKRESEIVQLVVRGESTSEIATLLLITSNTVQQHLKAIFDKVGVHSRRELVGQLFSQHYQPRIAAGQPLDTDGRFT